MDNILNTFYPWAMWERTIKNIRLIRLIQEYCVYYLIKKNVSESKIIILETNTLNLI